MFRVLLFDAVTMVCKTGSHLQHTFNEELTGKLLNTFDQRFSVFEGNHNSCDSYSHVLPTNDS